MRDRPVYVYDIANTALTVAEEGMNEANSVTESAAKNMAYAGEQFGRGSVEYQNAAAVWDAARKEGASWAYTYQQANLNWQAANSAVKSIKY